MKNIYIITILLVALCCSRCKESFNKLIPEQSQDNDKVDVIFGTPKVLLILVDGARGRSVEMANIPQMRSLLDNSIYSWVSLGDEDAEDVVSNWSDLFTGVKNTKHSVLTDDLSSNRFHNYPLLFDRLKIIDPTLKSEVITSSVKMESLLKNSTNVVKLQSDVEVKNKLVNDVKTTDNTILTVHFQEIQQVGQSKGFDNSIPEYKQAIERFDSHVGEIIAALKSRENYSKENWLVIIQSCQGGNYEIPATENDNTVFSNPKLNGFTIMYSPKYSSYYINKPYMGNRFIGDFLRFRNQEYAYQNGGDPSLYNFGKDNITIELKLKKNKGPNNNYQFNYASLIGKRGRWQAGWNTDLTVRGWVIYLENKYWVFNAAGSGAHNQFNTSTVPLNDGTWNTLTVVSEYKNNTRNLKLYTNGTLAREGDLTSYGDFDTNDQFRIGVMPSTSAWNNDCQIADVRIWKAALSPEIVKQYACEIGVDENHPYYNYLAGYWPMLSVDDGVIRDEGPFGSHMRLSNKNMEINRQNDFICSPSLNQINNQVIKNSDIPAQMLAWLKISRQESWQLDGRVWAK